MRKPNFLIIGAQKSGTSWLHRFLESRPDVYVPRERKELMFFDNKIRYSELGLNGYLEFFRAANDESAVGEITPGYLWTSQEHPGWGSPGAFRREIPERVKKALGADTKLIAVLRNPIDRALSGYMHHLRKGRINRGETLRENFHKHEIVHLGFYGAHLARWAEVYSRENFLTITYEGMFDDPHIRASVLEHIGAAPDYGNDLAGKKVYGGLGFQRTDGAAYAHDGLLIASREDIQALREAYAPDVSRLAADWDIDTSAWSPDF